MEEMSRAAMRAMLWNWGHALSTVAGYEQEMRVLWHAVADARDTLGAQRLSGMPGAGEVSDPVLRAVMATQRRIEEYERGSGAMAQRIQSRLELKNVVDECVARLSDVDQRVLTLRYKNGMSWLAISIKLSYSLSQVRYHDTRAVDALRGMEEIRALSNRRR